MPAAPGQSWVSHPHSPPSRWVPPALGFGVQGGHPDVPDHRPDPVPTVICDLGKRTRPAQRHLSPSVTCRGSSEPPVPSRSALLGPLLSARPALVGALHPEASAETWGPGLTPTSHSRITFTSMTDGDLRLRGAGVPSEPRSLLFGEREQQPPQEVARGSEAVRDPAGTEGREGPLCPSGSFPPATATLGSPGPTPATTRPERTFYLRTEPEGPEPRAGGQTPPGYEAAGPMAGGLDLGELGCWGALSRARTARTPAPGLGAPTGRGAVGGLVGGVSAAAHPEAWLRSVCTTLVKAALAVEPRCPWAAVAWSHGPPPPPGPGHQRQVEGQTYRGPFGGVQGEPAVCVLPPPALLRGPGLAWRGQGWRSRLAWPLLASPLGDRLLSSPVACGFRLAGDPVPLQAPVGWDRRVPTYAHLLPWEMSGERRRWRSPASTARARPPQPWEPPRVPGPELGLQGLRGAVLGPAVAGSDGDRDGETLRLASPQRGCTHLGTPHIAAQDPQGWRRLRSRKVYTERRLGHGRRGPGGGRAFPKGSLVPSFAGSPDDPKDPKDRELGWGPGCLRGPPGGGRRGCSSGAAQDRVGARTPAATL
ncbi:collagen alpha-1(I) chain-like [Choloepus didactylus]|uniref:collagen alpha-1(I) chain-like n=1 Tax=Choloepus didactylus TaxID=27675 RepID=UPI0018A0140C|nr:collagen alpha-1(I) chain-like [Choloepus didactylus]